MKKTLVICCTAILLGLLLTFTTVRAAESDVVFQGDSGMFADIADSNYLFGNFGALYPGCDVSRTIHTHNPDSRIARIYLHAKAVSEEYLPLLRQISLSVLDDNGNTLYTSADVINPLLLCELSGGQSRDVRIRLHVNRKADKDFLSTNGKIDFVFSAEEYAPHESSSDFHVPKTGSNPAVPAAALSGVLLSLAAFFTVRKHH